ncbi:inner membrane protein YhjD [soil metagenome]|jgi:membrane protein
MGIGDQVTGIRKRATDGWRNLKERRPGIAHVVTGYRHYKDNHGDHLAAAITYFSFLALFPLILLGASVAGFVLAAHPNLAQDLYDSIHKNVPGAFGDTIASTVKSAIANRAGVGIIGVVGVALAGLGWIANLRTAIDTVWGLPEAKRSFITSKVADSLVLFGLGLGLIVSLALTAGGTAASGELLRLTHLRSVPGAGVFAGLIGIALGIGGSMLVFGWLLIGLPQVKISRRTALRTTLLAAVGFEVLKVLGTYYIARVIKSPAAAAIGPVVGILVWIDLVCRFLLYCVAWSATATPQSQPELLAEELPPAPVESAAPLRPAIPSVSPIGIAAGLLSTGAAIGGAGVAALQRRRRRAARRPQQ